MGLEVQIEVWKVKEGQEVDLKKKEKLEQRLVEERMAFSEVGLPERLHYNIAVILHRTLLMLFFVLL